jgi:exonuclease III
MTDYTVPFMVYHQNIRSFNGKVDELLSLWTNEYPHILCLTEHHLWEQEISKLCCSPYILAAKYCRNKSKFGGVCICVHESLFTSIDLYRFCKEHDFEVCATKLCLKSNSYCIISIYRSPLGKLPYFTNILYLVLNKLYSISTNIILCGDININYLDKRNDRIQLDSSLATYSLYNTVNFPTRVGSKYFMAIDGIFIDKYKLNNYSVITVVNGLSNHDAQLLLLNNIKIKYSNPRCCAICQINKVNMDNFKPNLSYELWEEIFLDEEVDKLFNNFLNTYLRIFNISFPVKKLFNKYNDKAWLTTGTVKLVQGGIARDRIYFPNWAIFRIIQNCKKKKLEIN